MPAANVDPQLYAPEWAQVLADMGAPPQICQTKHAVEAPSFDRLLSSSWDQSLPQYGLYPLNSHFPPYQEQIDSNQGNSNVNENAFGGTNGLSDIDDLGMSDTLGIDHSKFVQPQESMT